MQLRSAWATKAKAAGVKLVYVGKRRVITLSIQQFLGWLWIDSISLNADAIA